jgi:site-specific DNA recombinase
MKLRLDGYIRVSQVGDREGDSFISPEVQRDGIAAWAAARGHALTFLEPELNRSGGDADRPVFNSALERAERGESDGIVAWKLDRFARDALDAGLALRRLDQVGAVLYTVQENIDASTPEGKFSRDTLLNVAEMQLGRIRSNWQTARQKAVERGIHLASRTPAGYRRKRVRGNDGKLRPEGPLLLDKKAAPVVRDTFRRRAQGAPYSELAQILTEKKVSGGTGNGYWTVAAVSKLLRNRVYLGEARSGEFVKPDAHPAIISEAEFRAAQKARSVTPLRRKGESVALLSGLARCAGCRYCLRSERKAERGGSDQRSWRYQCAAQHAPGRCPTPVGIGLERLEPYVLEEFMAALGPGGVLAWAVPDAKEAQRLQRALDAAREELDAYTVGVRVADVGRDAYIAGIQARQAALEAAQADLDGSGTGPALPAQDLQKAWPDLTRDEQRQLLASAIDAVFVRPGSRWDPIEERVLILWRGEAPTLLPKRGQRLEMEPYTW